MHLSTQRKPWLDWRGPFSWFLCQCWALVLYTDCSKPVNIKLGKCQTKTVVYNVASWLAQWAASIGSPPLEISRCKALMSMFWKETSTGIHPKPASSHENMSHSQWKRSRKCNVMRQTLPGPTTPNFVDPLDWSVASELLIFSFIQLQADWKRRVTFYPIVCCIKCGLWQHIRPTTWYGDSAYGSTPIVKDTNQN